MNLLSSVLFGAPSWVWPLLAILIFVGARATQFRTVSTWPIYVLPLSGALAVNAVDGLSPNASTWILFFAGYSAGAVAGYSFQHGIVVEHIGSKVALRGEWITLTVLLIVFWLNFAAGAVNVIAPDVFATDAFQKWFAALAGLAAGSFLGRAVKTYRLS